MILSSNIVRVKRYLNSANINGYLVKGTAEVFDIPCSVQDMGITTVFDSDGYRQEHKIYIYTKTELYPIGIYIQNDIITWNNDDYNITSVANRTNYSIAHYKCVAYKVIND